MEILYIVCKTLKHKERKKLFSFSFIGLPLGLYTSHWQRTVNIRGGCLSAGASSSISIAQQDCQSSYAPDLDYDIQGLFEIDE